MYHSVVSQKNRGLEFSKNKLQSGICLRIAIQKDGQVTKPIVKNSYAINYCMLFKELKVFFDEVTSCNWPQLISKLLVALAYLHVASDWPCTFFTPIQGVFV